MTMKSIQLNTPKQKQNNIAIDIERRAIMAYHIKIFHGEEIISDLIKPKFSDVEWCYTTLETLVGTDWAKGTIGQNTKKLKINH